MIAAPAQDKEPVTEGPKMSDQQAMEKRIEDKLFPPQKQPAQAKSPAAQPKQEAQDTVPGGEDTVDGGEDTPAGGADTMEGAAAEETFEFEYEGSRYAVPKELKKMYEGHLRQEDYTKKTMTAADRQRHADLIIQQSQQSQQMQVALAPKVEALNQTQNQLKQYEQVDWNAWIASDPTAAQKGMLQWQVLKEQRTTAERELNAAAQEQMRVIQETQAKLADENIKILKRDLKGWDVERHKTLNGWAEKTYGFSAPELSRIYDSRVVKMMHDAQQWHALQESKPQAAKKAAQVATLKPAATDGRNAKQGKEAELKRAIRVAKSDKDRQTAVQALLEHRL